MTKSHDQQRGVLVGTGTTSVAAAAPSAPSGCQARHGEKLAGQRAVPLPPAPRVYGYLMPLGESDWHGQECSYTVSLEEPAVCPISGRGSSVSSAPSNVEVKEVRRVRFFATPTLAGLPPHPLRLGGRGRRRPRRVSVPRGEHRAVLGVTGSGGREGCSGRPRGSRWGVRSRLAPRWEATAGTPRSSPRRTAALTAAGRRQVGRPGGGRTRRSARGRAVTQRAAKVTAGAERPRAGRVFNLGGERRAAVRGGRAAGPGESGEASRAEPKRAEAGGAEPAARSGEAPGAARGRML